MNTRLLRLRSLLLMTSVAAFACGGDDDGGGGGNNESTGPGAEETDAGETNDPDEGTTGDPTGGADESTGTDGEACTDYRQPGHGPDDSVIVAGGLTASFLTREAGNHTDQMVFWPPESDTPTHLITCVEGGPETIEGGLLNPSVQRINLNDGTVETILRGLNRCDGIRTTAWGTIVATEEEGFVADDPTGGVYEILDPLVATDYSANMRANGMVADASGSDGSSQIIKRSGLATMAWEGIVITPEGSVIGGDELRPGSYADANASDDTDGGAIIKFIPDTPFAGGDAITSLATSPLATGSNYALRISCNGDTVQFGQGCEIGNGEWVPVDAVTARPDADAVGATGFYRPEDMHQDPNFEGEGLRFCWTNTGNRGASNWGEVICGVDSDPNAAQAGVLSVTINRFIEGDTEFNAPDNLAFQSNSPNLYVIEDNRNGDVWACLPDGGDRDIKSDGCARMLSVIDESAEPTGFEFSPDGNTAYVSVQHSADCAMPLYDGYPTDDIIKITGFTTPDADAIAAFGGTQDTSLSTNASTYFGVGEPLAASSTDETEDRRFGTFDGDDLPADGFTSFGEDASGVIDLAEGLSATFLTRTVSNHADQMAFYPATNPTHLIVCIENEVEEEDGVAINPSVQRIDLTNGEVETILHGLERCDGIRTTPWGTVLATEEEGIGGGSSNGGATGGVYEILDPINTTGYSVNRSTGAVLDENGAQSTSEIVNRFALATMAWEGLAILPSGVVVGGDELRPGSYELGTDSDTDGGAIFKFVPTTLHDGSPITNLDQSPLRGGTNYAMQISCVDDNQQFGQGCEVGNAAWVSVTAANARPEAYAAGATGYYRPEDLHADPNYNGEGVRFCWTNTGSTSADNFGEVLCATDTQPDVAPADTRTVVVNRLIEGDTEFNQPDNLAFQAGGNTYIIEDNSHGDIWACLPDGADRDIKSDGCVRIATIPNATAEPTGFIFDDAGTTAYVSIQHSDNDGHGELNVNGFDTDDIVIITGFADPATLTSDFGATREAALEAATAALFGFTSSLSASATQP